MPKTETVYTPADIDLDSEEAKVYSALYATAGLSLILTPHGPRTDEQKAEDKKLAIATMKTVVEQMGFTISKKELPSIFGES